MTLRFVLVSILVQRKFTTDRYVVYKWSGWKFSPSPKGEGLFPYFRGGKETGIYIIKDRLFEEISNPYLRKIRQVIDHIIIVLKIRIREFVGWYHSIPNLSKWRFEVAYKTYNNSVCEEYALCGLRGAGGYCEFKRYHSNRDE